MSGAPDVSVVVPTHGRDELLILTIASVLRQEAVALELIVVDDGSDVDVQAIVEGADDDRIVLMRHAVPRGVVAARNAGIDLARGHWIGFCDDDDVWAPYKLKLQLEAGRESSRGWVYGGSVDIDLDHRVLGGAEPFRPEEVVERLRTVNVVPGGGSGVIVEARLLGSVGAFDPGMQGTAMEDWELWLRLAGTAPPAWVNAPLVGYRVHPTNAHLETEALADGLRALALRHDVRLRLPEFERYLAFASLRHGRRRDALRHFGRAARAGQPSRLAREVAGSLRGDVRRRMGIQPRLTVWQRCAQQWLDEFCDEVERER